MKKYQILIINISYIFILNILFSLLIFKKLSFLSILFYLLEGFTFGSIVTLISNISKNNKLNKIINITIATFLGIIFVAQFVHYHFYACFFSFFSLLHGGQVFAFIEAIIKIIIENIWGFILLFIFIPIIWVLIIKKDKTKEKIKSIKLLIPIISSISLFFIISTLLTGNNYSYHNLLYKVNDQSLNTQKMGVLTAEIMDTARYIFGFNSAVKEEEKATKVFKDYDNIDYNVADINFDKLIKEEKNKKIKKLHNYFKGQTPSNKNEYTGIFKGKNLIFITAESFDFKMIDKNLTPTLYKMNNEGITFSNFYTPIYYASTSDGEYAGLTGLLPKSGTWSYLASEANNYPYSYPNLLEKYGYKSFYYHNGEYNFYNRNTVSKNFGYDKFNACGAGLEKSINCNLWPESDIEMFDTTFDDYKSSRNFVTYYMTISTHLSHNFKTNDMAKKWQNKVKDSKYSESVKAYQSSIIELDKALEGLITNLKKEDLLESTVIVLTPDHFPYGLNKSEIKEFKSLKNDYDLYKSGLIIYNSVTKKDVIDKYSSNIDILPTLLNMYGLEYDSRLIIGQDIMSNKEGIVIFNDRSFLTDKGYYNEKTNKFSNKKTSKDYINNKRQEVYNKVNVSSNMLDLNYYKYIK